MVIAARLLGGNVIGYAVPPAYRESTWKWLNSLSCVTSTWEESLDDFRERRLWEVK